MRSNNLVPYLGGGSSGNSKRQGIIVSWNPDTGENVVDVGGALLQDLPFYNSTEASLMSAGDVVVVETFGASFAITGRIFYPNTAEANSAFQAVTSRVQGASNSGTGTRNSNTWGDLTGTGTGPSVTARIGTSGRAWVSWSAEMGQVLNGALIQYMYRSTPHVGIQISGASSVSPSDVIALNYHFENPVAPTAGTAQSLFWIQSAMTYVYEGLNPGLTTFTMKYKHDTINPAGANAMAFGARSLIVFPL